MRVKKSGLEGNKTYILLITIVCCVLLNGYATLVLHKEVVYTHFFYLPIILAGLWYYRKAVYIAIFFGLLHVFTTSSLPGFDLLIFFECMQRAVIFLAVAYVIGAVSEARAKAERGVTSERDRFRRILHTIGEAVYILDPELRIKDVNRTHLSTFNKKREEVVGRRCYEVFYGRSRRCPDCPLSEVFSKGVSVRVERMVPSHGSGGGGRKYFDIIFSPLSDERGDVVEVICDVRDITERKEMEERFARSERLAAIGEFSAGLAHELRQPLGVISNAVYFLSTRLGSIRDEKVGRHLKILEKEVKHANRLISDLLDFAREEKPILSPCNVNQVIEEVVSSIEFPPNIEVIRDMKEDIPQIMADNSQIQRICFNIITNAISAMPEGGCVEIKTERGGGGDGVGGGEWIEISVRDTGEGIPRENLKKVFEPLFTTKSRGIGLGLALCKRYVEAHGGRIEVESGGEKGTGSTFRVRLPVDPAACTDMR